MSIVIVFKMFFEEEDVLEGLIVLAWFSLDFDEALELIEFFKGLSCVVWGVVDIGEVFIRDESVEFVGVEGSEGIHDDDHFEVELNGGSDTLQMGHWPFLLRTRIL